MSPNERDWSLVVALMCGLILAVLVPIGVKAA